jgi:hypothetical protein
MNLKEILHRRDICIFCQSPLTYYCVNYPNLSYQVTENYFRISSPFKNTGVLITFEFDGKYTKCKRNLELFKENIEIIKSCVPCISKSNGNNADTKLVKTALSEMTQLRPLSKRINTEYHTALNNLMFKQCAYKFQIMDTYAAKDTYASVLTYEITRYYDEHSFWHLDTSFVTNSSVICYGNWNDTLDQVLNLKMPYPVNVVNVKNTEQFLQKCKTLILMS